MYDLFDAVPRWKDVVDPYNPAHLTPVGYDFSIGSVQKIVGRGTIRQTKTDTPEYQPVHTDGGFYRLLPGMYIVTLQEKVKIPAGYVGLMWSRSSLLRCGASLHTAIWDAGYEGISKTTLVVHYERGIDIEEGARIGHMILLKLDMLSSLYGGQYQNEGLR